MEIKDRTRRFNEPYVTFKVKLKIPEYDKFIALRDHLLKHYPAYQGLAFDEEKMRKIEDDIMENLVNNQLDRCLKEIGLKEHLNRHTVREFEEIENND